MEIELQDEHIQKQLLYREQMLIRRVRCQRRFNVSKVPSQNPKFANQLMWITNYRILFHGEQSSQFKFAMVLILTQITSIDYRKNKQNKFVMQIKTRTGQMDPNTKLRKQQTHYFGFEAGEDNNIKRIKDTVQELRKIPNCKSEEEFKVKLLVADKVRYQIYHSLVVKRKLIKDEDFWSRDQDLKEYINQKKIQFQKHLNQRKTNVAGFKLEYTKLQQKPCSINKEHLEGYSQFRQLEQLKPSSFQKINDQSVTQFRKQIQEMYLKDSKEYRRINNIHSEQNINEGIKIIPTTKSMQIQQHHNNSNVSTVQMAPAVKVPIKTIKFEISNQELIRQVKEHDASRQTRASHSNRELTKKVVEYVRLFYQMMREDNPNQKQMEKQLRNLSKEVEKEKELHDFIKVSFENFLRLRGKTFQLL